MSRDENATYYDAGGIETLDVLKAKATMDQFVGHCLLTAMTYLARANFKGTFWQDVEKARNYLNFLLEAKQK